MILRYLTVAVTTSALTLAVVAASGLASPTTHHARTVTATVGDIVVFKGFDLSCNLTAHDPNGYESGPLFYCARVTDNNSRGIGGSRYHFFETNVDGTRRIYQVPRTP
jgi:hypothetical protein